MCCKSVNFTFVWNLASDFGWRIPRMYVSSVPEYWLGDKSRAWIMLIINSETSLEWKKMHTMI